MIEKKDLNNAMVGSENLRHPHMKKDWKVAWIDIDNSSSDNDEPWLEPRATKMPKECFPALMLTLSHNKKVRKFERAHLKIVDLAQKSRPKNIAYRILVKSLHKTCIGEIELYYCHRRDVLKQSFVRFHGESPRVSPCDVAATR